MSDKIASQIEQESGRKLTNRQREFAKYYVEGRYSNAECARKAGFVGENVHIYASKLLNGREHPQVLEYVKELREEKERRYGVTLIGQLQRLDQLSHSAEEAGQFSAAINAEKIRSALGGLTIDRRETINKLDELSGPLIGAYFYSRAVVRVLWRLRAYVREPFFREPRSAKLWKRCGSRVGAISGHYSGRGRG
jgi:hypothetical protein